LTEPSTASVEAGIHSLGGFPTVSTREQLSRILWFALWLNLRNRTRIARFGSWGSTLADSQDVTAPRAARALIVTKGNKQLVAYRANTVSIGAAPFDRAHENIVVEIFEACYGTIYRVDADSRAN